MWGRGMCVFNGVLVVVELESNFIESFDKNFFFYDFNLYFYIIFVGIFKDFE